MTDLPSVLTEALGTVFEAATGKESDGMSHKGCFAELPALLDYVRSEEYMKKIVEELTGSGVSSRKAASSPIELGGRLDPKVLTSLDSLFGVPSGLPAPITDIIAVFKGEPIPEGYSKVSKSVGGGLDADLNKSSGGRPMFLCVARKPGTAPVTSIAIVFGATGEFFPPGFQPVKHHSTGKSANFNSGTTGQEICMGVYRGHGSAVVELGVWYPDRVVKPFNAPEKVPAGHAVLKRTVLGHVSNLNASTRGPPVFLTVRKDLSHLYSLFVGWKSLAMAPAEIRRSSSTIGMPFSQSGSLDSVTISRLESQRFSNPAASDIGDIDSEFPSGDSRAGSSTTDLEPLTPAPEETVAAEDLDTDWAVHDESTLSGRFAWIFSSGEELSGPATANSVTLGVLLAGLYHPRVSVVSACLKQLGSLIKQGWFRKDNWAKLGGMGSEATDFGSIVLEVVVASATDAVSTRPDLLHTDLSSLLVTFVKQYGANASVDGCGFGLRPLALYRSVEAVLRMFFFFSRKKLYSGRIARWAETSGRHRDLDSLKRTFEAARRDALSSRAALSELVRALVTSVETEFETVLPGDDVFGVQDSTILSALVAPFKSLVWSFRTFDSASAGFCLSLHHAASRVIINWASAMAGQPSGANLAKYATADPNTLRSCAVDVLVTLGIICKIASLPLAMDANGAPKSVSDLQTKVAVLQLCGESIAVAGDRFKQVAPLSYFLRRIVAPAVLGNCSEARITLPSVFRAVLGCISNMWTHYRQSLKTELGVLAHVVMLRTLSSQFSLPQQKADVLTELRSWIQVPQDLVEMYLNFDNDAPYNHMRLVYHLVHSLTFIACGGLNNVRMDTGIVNEANEALFVTAALALQRDAIDMLENVLRSVMDAAATVHLIAMDAKTRKLSEVNWQWDSGSTRDLTSPPLSRGHSRQSSVMMRHLTKKQMDEVLEEGLAICNTKSVGKGLKKLTDEGYLSGSAEEAVSFLRLCGDRISAREIGDFLGDIGRGPEEEAWYNRVRECYMSGLDFTGLPFDVAFRYLLTNGGFFLPGEAQKIDRITQAFARAYCEMNSIDDIPASDITEPRLYRPSNSDVAEVLTFSLIMLHTDAHNPNIKKEKKMTMAQFVSNNRGIDGGKDLPRDFLEYLYNATVSHEIKMLPGAGGNGESKDNAPTTNPNAFVGEMTSSVYRALAHLSSLASSSSVHRKNFSRDVVACMLEDIWPDVQKLMRYLAVERSDPVSTEPAIAGIALNVVKYATSASLFLGLAPQIRESADVLERVETRIMGHVSQPWHKTLAESTELGVDSLIAAVHLTMADIANTAADVADKQNLAETAARFKQPFRRELESVTSRRVLYEGFLTKVCSNGRGKHKKYRFFLFTDLLVYASTGAFSSMYTMHRSLPLEGITFVDSPPEIATVPHSFKLVTDGKELFLYSDSEEEHMAWRRRIREAVRLIRTTGDVTPASPAVTPAAGADGRPVFAYASDSASGRGDVNEEPSTYGFQSALIASAADAVGSSQAQVPPEAVVHVPKDGAGASSEGRGVELATSPSSSTSPSPPAIPSRLRNLSSKELKDTFRAALEKSRPLLQAPSAASSLSSPPIQGSLSDLQKLQFYGYFKQATKGDISDEEASTAKSDVAERAKVEAWKKCKNLSRRDAMRAFVYLMYQVDPTWDAKKSLETVPECA